MKEQATEGEKILSAKKHISNIGLVSRIDEECSKLDIKKNSQIRYRTKNIRDISLRRIYNWQVSI